MNAHPLYVLFKSTFDVNVSHAQSIQNEVLAWCLQNFWVRARVVVDYFLYIYIYIYPSIHFNGRDSPNPVLASTLAISVKPYP